MTERKRRGLGRGLGALINSDGQEAEASGATAHAVEPEAPEEVSRETPVDVAETLEAGSDEGGPEATAVDPFEESSTTAQESTDGEPASLPEDEDAAASEEQPEVDDHAVSDHETPADETDVPDDGSNDASDGAVETVDEVETSNGVEAPERPIDVFFSAKSHLDTQRVSRGTAGSSTRTTTSRRGRGNGRVEMPDVLGDRARRSPHSAVSTESAPSAASAEQAQLGEPAEAADTSDGPSVAVPEESPAESTTHGSSTQEAPNAAETAEKASAPKRTKRTKKKSTPETAASQSTPTDAATSASGSPSDVTTTEAATSASAAEMNGASPIETPAPAAAASDDVPRGTDGAVDGSVDGAEFRSVPVEAIVPNPRQPRQEFDEEDMAELVHSVREIGVLQPIVVRRIADDQYELVMGERRWRASKSAERTEIPAIIRATDDIDLLRDALLENIHRSELNPLEEAAAYRQLLDDFRCTQDELATRIGRSRPQISNTLRLMKLPPGVQRRVAAGVLSSGHARALLGLSTQEQMEELAARIVAEGLSVRATEEAVTMMQQPQEETDGSHEAATRLPSNTRYQQLDEYADALTDRLDTQVKITLGARKGRIAIDFGSIEDLHRLMEMIGQSTSS